MREGIFRFFTGSTDFEVCCEKSLSDRFLGEVLKRISTDIFGISRKDDGTLVFSCVNGRVRELESIAERFGVELDVARKRGFLHFMFVRKRRAGLLVGILLCFVFMLVSENMIWEIRVGGNVSVPTEDILDNLEMNGFSEGTFYPSVNLEGLYHRFLIADTRISWIAVNIKGTVALIEVHEREILPPKTDYTEKVNLVAARDGRIVRIDALFGGKEVKNGDYVTKGQLLVSSFFKTRASGEMFQSAKGHVYAETERVFDVKLPFESYEKRYTGDEKKRTVYKILGKRFSPNSFLPIPYDNYDAERREGYVTLFDRAVLPLKYETTVFREYETVKCMRTEEELKSLAYDEMYAIIAHELDGADILSASYSEEIRKNDASEKYYILRSTVKAVEDIAVCEDFGID